MGKDRGLRRRRRKQEILFCAAECKSSSVYAFGQKCLTYGFRYDCVIDAVHAVGWRTVCGQRKGQENDGVDDPDYDLCNVYWIDVANIAERMNKMRAWQRINHFPGMSNVARKNRLAQNLEKMRREFPRQYSFYPRTWVLPLELADFRAQFDSAGLSSRFYIVKPDSGCQGRGIYLTQTFDSISPLEQVVAQHYIRKPFLIDGFKFDLRLFHDGLVRLCTEEYLKPNAENVSMRCMHLTNYAINKHNEKFQSNSDVHANDVGSKRSLRWFMEYIAAEKGQARAEILWRRMGQMCVKVIISILPTLVREYESIFFKDTGGQDPSIHQEIGSGPVAAGEHLEGSRCFEVLGIDVIVDHALKPWLVEVNHLPSFATDSPLDHDIKSRLIEQTISIIKAKSNDRRAYEQAQRYKAEKRLYDRQPVALSKLDERSVSVVSVVAPMRQHIESLFRLHAPRQLDKLDSLMRKYAGREAKLVQLIEKKYIGQTSALPPSLVPPCETSVHVASQSPPGCEDKKSVADDAVEAETRMLIDFERIYPALSEVQTRNQHRPDYKALIKYVFSQDEKRIKRLSCPLRQNRGSALGFAGALPRLTGLERERGARIPWGDPFRRVCGVKFADRDFSLHERKPLPMPGQKQAAAADRLARGFSSRQHASAPSSLSCAVPEYAHDEFAHKVANTIAHAREWRRKIVDARDRRGCVPLQPKTYVFDEGPPDGLFGPAV
mmetsp:Transcript_31639/g.97801  ORF Transcript_31639/g.97801 Transcript_31639/m.97801 type:complete len:720 (+) Transcript_31639:421-2580(+)